MCTQDAISIFLAGVEAVKPSHFIPQYIQLKKNVLTVDFQNITLSEHDKVYIAAVGKAAAAMALETEKIIADRIASGIVVTKYHHALPLTFCSTIEAGHPVPDASSIEGGKAIIELFKKTSKDDIIIMLISGGASALLADHPPGCTLQQLQQTVQLLLDCGAPIDEMNSVRKHLSLIKGGQLMQYTSAKVLSLILSDVPGDDLSVIASGLTVADDSSFEDAWNIITKYQLEEKLPAAVSDWLKKGLRKEITDTPKRGNLAFENVHNTIVANNAIALSAAAQKAAALGYHTVIISSMLSGEASIQATHFTQELKKIKSSQPACLLWGGETTVTIKGNGKGGRNQEFALAALCQMKTDAWFNSNPCIVMSGGTDGTDGPTDAAGAIADAAILEATTVQALDPTIYLNNNDAYHFFEKTKGLVITGPTQTNVMDIVIGLIKPGE
ncbi:MAG: DUF4147 domain-containing protein [Agriterribacter sp.]